jgi:FkbM family methyltransferase
MPRSPATRRSWPARTREALAKGREIRAQSRYQYRRYLPDLLSAVLPGPVWVLFPHRLVGLVLGHLAFEPLGNAGELIRFGNYTIDPEGLDESSVVYSVGLGGNSSFDADLATKLSCEVHVFDPTPGVLPFGERLEAEHDTVTFHPRAMWLRDGTLPMYGHAAPNRTRMKFGSLAESNWGDQVTMVPATTFAAAMADLGHDRVDLLKADIEGGGLPLVGAVLRGRDLPGQIAVEFEVPLRPLDLLAFAGEIPRVVRRAESRGFGAYLVAHKRGRGLEVLFIDRSG